MKIVKFEYGTSDWATLVALVTNAAEYKRDIRLVSDRAGIMVKVGQAMWTTPMGVADNG